MVKEEALFIELEALADAAALALESGKTNTAAGVLYAMQDILQQTLAFYPSKTAEK